MPSHVPRPRRRRLVAPIVLGVAAFIGVGSIASGTPPSTGAAEPTGMVAGIVDVAPASTTPSARQAAPTSPDADGDARAPLPVLPDASEALPGGAPPLGGLTGYRWPLAKPRITLPFGPTPWGSRVVDGKKFHDGLDMATFCGDRIVAAHDGTVLAAGRRYDDVMGWVGDLSAYYRRLDEKKLWSTLPNVVVIDDGNGYRSMYAHFSEVVVRAGQVVRAGDLLGKEGMTGRASGCHLHYGLFSPFEEAEFAIDPAVVKRMKVPSAEIARVDPELVLPPRPKPTKPTGVPAASPSAIPNPSADPNWSALP